MRTETIKIYTIDEHPNKDKCYDWIRDNWHDLNQHSVEEVIESLKALEKEIGGSIDYSISQVPDRGEYIRLTGNYNREALCRLSAEDLPLTGTWSDYDVIVGMRTEDPEKVLTALHADTEHQYSDEGLFEMCEANEYEFYENGKVV